MENQEKIKELGMSLLGFAHVDAYYSKKQLNELYHVLHKEWNAFNKINQENNGENNFKTPFETLENKDENKKLVYYLIEKIHSIIYDSNLLSVLKLKEDFGKDLRNASFEVWADHFSKEANIEIEYLKYHKLDN